MVGLQAARDGATTLEQVLLSTSIL
jgi:hypothetical protein